MLQLHVINYSSLWSQVTKFRWKNMHVHYGPPAIVLKCPYRPLLNKKDGDCICSLWSFIKKVSSWRIVFTFATTCCWPLQLFADVWPLIAEFLSLRNGVTKPKLKNSQKIMALSKLKNFPSFTRFNTKNTLGKKIIFKGVKYGYLL